MKLLLLSEDGPREIPLVPVQDAFWVSERRGKPGYKVPAEHDCEIRTGEYLSFLVGAALYEFGCACGTWATNPDGSQFLSWSVHPETPEEVRHLDDNCHSRPYWEIMNVLV